MQAISERFKISPFLVFFAVSSMQIGIGVLGYQRIIAKSAGYDAWISVILAGIAGHITLWMMYSILQKTNGSIVETNQQIFGKLIGNILNLLLALYYTALVVGVLRTYIEVVQVWMFPDLKIEVLAAAFMLLTIYIVLGGFRAVVGVCFFSIILPSYLILTFVYTFEYANFRMLLPIFDHSILDILKATKDMTLTILGFETLFIYYPFIKNAGQSKKWAHLAILSTTLIYVVITVITFAFFSEKQLQKHIWATLSMWKIVEMPFIERFEYLGIATWTIVILPNICLAAWCASRIVKQVVNIQQKYALIVLSVICTVAVCLIKTRENVNLLNDMLGYVGFYFLYGFVPFIFILLHIIHKVRKKG
ncbi:spore germination protein (amino acid permease) [Anoxybacillus vitaminiphilus]|uniref:Spore germination protein (Amino acid permease) n=1 Tax=Paranoxybacillus vitaminiphilus TaxID=581036 RepID=A0A327YDN8_9BACL|nr:GerAB/ArcD/ProY family transporter [Anoxybacillus vitaminiphilus]RAK18607.1 spore germination protein (amino acid permease) [Anoxybacillus vitaminiphilus]